MPRSTQQALLDHFKSNVTTLAMCIKITRKDGEVYAYTNHDTEIEFNGIVYKPGLAGRDSAFSHSADASVSNMEIQAYLESDEITRGELYVGLFDGATVEVFVINYTDPTQGELKVMKGEFGEVQLKDEQAQVEFRSLAQYLQQNLGRTYTNKCDVEKLGDSRCGVDLSTYAAVYTVQEIKEERHVFVIDGSESNEWYKYGEVVWESDTNNAGLSMEIKTEHNGEMSLLFAMPYDIQVGDTLVAYPGCDRAKETCKEKFDNVVNFRGFDMIPGRDSVSKYPDSN